MTPAPKIRRAGALSVTIKLVMLAMVVPRVLRFRLGGKS
jgi:hypothetical protein